MNQDEIAQLRALEQAATPGPWEAGDRWVYTSPVYKDSKALANVLGDRYVDIARQAFEHARGNANAALIAATRNALPGLLDVAEEAERLTYERDTARHDALYQAANIAARRRDHSSRAPMTLRRGDERVWVDGYEFAANDIAQELNMMMVKVGRSHVVMCHEEREKARAAKAEAERDALRAELDALRGRVVELADEFDRGIPEGPAAIHFCPEGCGDIWESEATCCHEPGYRAAAGDLRKLLDGPA